MKQVRHKVFETNSSSTHSISISTNNPVTMDTLYVDETGTVIIYPGEFGWEVEEYTDAQTKASYCYTYCKNYNLDKLDMLTCVLMYQTGAKNVHYVTLEGSYPDGYIDHQSIDVCNIAFEDDETLRMFIFNRSSVLRTDNDNC